MTSDELLIAVLARVEGLSRGHAHDLMTALLNSEFSENEIAGLLTALHERGETPAELAGFADAIRRAASLVSLSDSERDCIVDNCGTGGDGSGTFNISTAAALLAAAAGVPVAKHGNRSITSRCGSADILERLGIPITHTSESAAAAIRSCNFAFLWAQHHHPAMRVVAPIRRALPFRTVFNLLGPLVNPAGARRQVLGVYSPQAVPLMAEALAEAGNTLHALVVHGHGGFDELSLSGPTIAAEVKGREVQYLEINPEDAGLQTSAVAIPGGSPEENEAFLHAVFAGEPGPAREIVLFNAAALFLVAGRTSTLRQGVEIAARVIDMGAAARLISKLSGNQG